MNSAAASSISASSSASSSSSSSSSTSSSSSLDTILLTHSPLEPHIITLPSLLITSSSGAYSSFIGTTRDTFEGKRVIELEYEAYESMALKQLNDLVKEIRMKWKSVTKCAILHRLGVVKVGEASVAIAVSSPHRRESIESVSWCIDELKRRVVIWKKEKYEDGSTWKENVEWREEQERIKRQAKMKGTKKEEEDENDYEEEDEEEDEDEDDDTSTIDMTRTYSNGWTPEHENLFRTALASLVNRTNVPASLTFDIMNAQLTPIFGADVVMTFQDKLREILRDYINQKQEMKSIFAAQQAAATTAAQAVHPARLLQWPMGIDGGWTPVRENVFRNALAILLNRTPNPATLTVDMMNAELIPQFGAPAVTAFQDKLREIFRDYIKQKQAMMASIMAQQEAAAAAGRFNN